MKKQKPTKSSLKELVKPVDIKTESHFFEVEALCHTYQEGLSCKAWNRSIDDEQDLLF